MNRQNRDALREELVGSLRVKDDTILDSLVEVIVHGEKRSPAFQVFTSLLDAGCTISELMTALLRCEWLTLQLIAPEVKNLSEKEQVKLVHSKLEYFNALQGTLFEIAQAHWDSVLSSECRSQVLSETHSNWLKTGYVTLYNVIDEIPVRASVSLFDATLESISVEITSELQRVIAADQEMRRAYIDSPDEKYRLVMLIDRVNSVKDATLKIEDIVLSNIRDRDFLRVSIHDDTHVQLLDKDGFMKAEALLSDISIGGLGLEKVSSMALEAGSIMTIKFNLGNIEANHPCTICWISHMEGRIGVSIRTNQKLQQALKQGNIEAAARGYFKTGNDWYTGYPPSFTSLKKQ